MIRITPTLNLDDSELSWSFIRASGPGGQNVNKVSSAVELRFDTKALPDELQHRLAPLAGRQLAKDGVLTVTSQRFRSQVDNRSDALNKLVTLLKRASVRPKRRIATKPSRAAKARRLDSKTKRSTVKKLRGAKASWD
jgi:ribosome-associated protein